MLFSVRRAELLATPFFADLTTGTADQLLAELQPVHVPGGAILFRAGDPGDSMYVVLTGRLRVSIDGPGGRREVLRELSRGDSVGELALLTGEARSATIRAIRDTDLAQLSRSGFERVAQSDPALIRRIAVQLASRQRQGRESVSSTGNLRTIAVLPVAGTDGAAEFTSHLIAALQTIRPTKQVSSATLKADFNLDLSAAAEHSQHTAGLANRLEAFEANHGLILYQADEQLTDWTRCCIRQADLVLIVDSGDRAPSDRTVGPLLQYFESCEITARIELVLLRRSNAEPAIATLKRLGELSAAAHHNLASSDIQGIARLARLVTGNATGLVLSGGGARGFAHIGVIRALDERKIPIDCIGGTSMGAVIAAQHALGWDWQTMARVNSQEWPRCEPQKNYTLPLVALNSARRMDRMLKSMFGDVAIQDLRGNFFCVSTNLTTAAAKIHRHGQLWKAVRASVSMPGIGPPAIENGEILVDGGLVDNLPVGTMKMLCQGRVYAVDVSEQVEFTSKLSESYAVSGWKMLWQQLNPFIEKPDIPNILNTLYRTTTVGGIRAVESAKTQADLCFEPPVSQFGVFEWRSCEKIIEAGYRYAIGKLEAVDREGEGRN
jgi:predicted acylesterase/phospholipase RssA/CRP-like cAMP-binding protein